MIKKVTVVAAIILFTLNIFAAKIGDVPGVEKPTMITVDGGHLFIVESSTVGIYNLKDLKLIKKFGKQGEGPQEFKTNPRRGIVLNVQPDYLMVDSIGKISYFSRDGKFQREVKTMGQIGLFNPLGEKYAGYSVTADEKRVLHVAVNVYDKDLKKGKEIYRFLHPFQPGKTIDPIRINRTPILMTCGNEIFVDGEGGIIHVFKENGEKVREITSKSFKKIKLSTQYIDRHVKFLKTDYRYKRVYERDKERIKFPEYFPIIRSYFIAKKKIYVLTYKKEGDKNELYVFDTMGKELKRTMVPFHEMSPIEIYPFDVSNNTFYQLLESEDGEGEWELHATRLK
jgi:hypothetical protein